MIPKIKRILYATDLSKNSMHAFRYAVIAARNHDAQIYILHVQERIPSADDVLLRDSGLGKRLKKLYETEREAAAEKIKKRLEEICRQELKDKPGGLKRVTIQVVDGNPAAAILQKAKELEVDLVVMGTHSKGALAHVFLGSVATKVLHRIKTPVFIIPIP